MGLVVLLSHLKRESPGDVRLGQFRVEFYGLAAGDLRFLAVVIARVPPEVDERTAVGDAGIGKCVIRINDNRARKQLSGKIKALAAELVEELPPLQVVVVRLNVRRGSFLDGSFLL